MTQDESLQLPRIWESTLAFGPALPLAGKVTLGDSLSLSNVLIYKIQVFLEDPWRITEVS